ncbi:hypothetical protein M378DRAFT_168795, partial [Amanita muscaria Koide BX008]
QSVPKKHHLPTSSLAVPSIPQSAQASTPTVSAKPHPRSLSLPRISIHNDCLIDV